MKKTILLFTCAILLFACSDDKKPLVNACLNSVILPSQSEVTFHSATDSITITTQGFWNLESLSLNNIVYSDYYNLSSLPSYIVENNDFVFEKCDSTTIFIKMFDNPTNKERQLFVRLQSGICYDFIDIRQAAGTNVPME